MSRPLRSAGLLPFRPEGRRVEVLIAHPGGPFWARRDNGAWSVVKGEVAAGENDQDAARREFEEETGWSAPTGEWIPLGETALRSGKTVVAWAVRSDYDPASLRPGTFTMHGREYPEIDRVGWMTPAEARVKLNPAQVVFLDRLETYLERT